MKQVTVIESEKFTYEELQSRLQLPEREFVSLLNYLMYDVGYLNKKNKSSSKRKYSFCYVGFIFFENIIIRCLPKYLNHGLGAKQIENHIDLLIKVFRKYYDETYKRQSFSTEDSEEFANNYFVTIREKIIRDYVEYGMYLNIDKTYNINGEGNIDWGITISETQSHYLNKKVVFLDLIREENIINVNDFFTQLHKYVLNDCLTFFRNNQLMELFDIPEVFLDYDRESFFEIYSNDMILSLIKKELNVQFNYRMQHILKGLELYFSLKSFAKQNYEFHAYGTQYFHVIWEKMCSDLLDNKINVQISDIPEVKVHTTAKSDEVLLKNLITIPEWIPEGEYEGFHAKDTLKLDIVSIFMNDNKKYFIISDAKYYDILLEKDQGLKNYPGVSDVSKQYLYYLSFKKFVETQKFDYFANIMIFPSEKIEIKEYGYVKMNLFTNSLDLPPIKLIKLQGEYVMKLYLEGITLSKQLISDYFIN